MSQKRMNFNELLPKACLQCGVVKSENEFNRDKRRQNGRESRCKECSKARVKKWRTDNREAYNAWGRKHYSINKNKWANHLSRRYGIGAHEYEEMFKNQNGACAICRISAADIGKTLAVDHDHATGEIRGLLCAECNRMLGYGQDEPEVLRAGADYLLAAKRPKRSSKPSSKPKKTFNVFD